MRSAGTAMSSSARTPGIVTSAKPKSLVVALSISSSSRRRNVRVGKVTVWPGSTERGVAQCHVDTRASVEVQPHLRDGATGIRDGLQERHVVGGDRVVERDDEAFARRFRKADDAPVGEGIAVERVDRAVLRRVPERLALVRGLYEATPVTTA